MFFKQRANSWQACLCVSGDGGGGGGGGRRENGTLSRLLYLTG